VEAVTRPEADEEVSGARRRSGHEAAPPSNFPASENRFGGTTR